MDNDANTPAVLRSRQVVLAIAFRFTILAALIAFPLGEVSKICAQCPTYGNSTQSFGGPPGLINLPVAMGDVDGDGDLDQLYVYPYFGGSTSGSLDLLFIENLGLNSGYLLERGNIFSGLPSGTFGFPTGIYLGDLDGDGDPDAIITREKQFDPLSTSAPSSHNLVFLNECGTYTYSQSLGSLSSNDMAFGDFDGDGDLDVLVVNGILGGQPFTNFPEEEENRVYLNQGGVQGGQAGTFSVAPNYSTPRKSRSVALGDLDDDGNLDAFIVNATANNEIYWGAPNSADLFNQVPSIGPVNGRVALGDLSGNSLPDIVLTSPNGLTEIWMNQYPNFSLGQQLGQSGAIADRVQLIDLNGDEQLDIYLGGMTGDKIYINDGAGNFNQSTQPSLPSTVGNFTFGNVNADCSPDFLGYVQPNSWGVGSILVSFGEGCGTALEDCSNSVDDDCDLLVDCEDPDCFNDPACAVPCPRFLDSGQLLFDDNSTAVALGDLDGDDDIDAFVVKYIVQGTYHGVLINQGGDQCGSQGLFIDSEQLIGSDGYWGAWDVALDDLDDDGDLDAFVATGEPNLPGIGGNRVYLNNGGTFTDTQQILGNFESRGVALGDLNNDTYVDAFVANTNGQPNRIWLNDGQGNFTDSTQSLGNSSSNAIELADLDNDGDLDAFVVNRDNEPNRVYINTLGTFSVTSQALGNYQSQDVALGDLDGDGYSDALVMNLLGNRVWLNDGTGNFIQTGQVFDANCTCVALGDLDTDGDLDAIVGRITDINNTTPTFDHVWINDGSGFFTNSGLTLGDGVFNYTSDIELCDLNGDGNLDAFETNGAVGGADLVFFGGCPPLGENCSNGIDDDCDGLIDCLDPDCLFNLDCQIMALPFDPGIKLTPGPPIEDGFAVHMALDDDKLVICTPLADAQGVDSGSVSIFQRDAATGGWQETQQLLPSNGSAMGRFGSSAATSANFIFIGAVGVGAAGPANGAVHVFERDATGAWAESQILEAAGASAFGTSLALRGDLLAIGNPASSATSSDSVHLFTLDTQSGQWIELQQLIPPLSDGASFGSSISLGDGIILVGRPSDPAGLGSDTGSASVYIRDAVSGSWVLEQELHSSTAQPLEAFGESVAVGDGVLIISAFAPSAGPNGPSASARSFERDPVSGEWLEAQQLSCSSGCGAPGYQAMALEGDILVIGESQDPTPGSVTIYQRDLATCQWLVVQQLMPSASSDGDGFGTSIAISGRTIAVGAPGDDELAPNAGAAYVFAANGLLRDCNGNGTEDQEDIASGFSVDCNDNGRPDECDISCVSSDCNSNGVPDECEDDCNGNGSPDHCDIETGISQDTNNNGVPDVCDLSCMAISQEGISLDAAGNFEYSFTLTNSSGEAPVVAEHLFIDVLSPLGVSVSEEWLPLNGLGDGQSIALSTTFIGATTGMFICLQISMHDATFAECCGLVHCGTIPDDPNAPCLIVEGCSIIDDMDGDTIPDG